MLKIENCNKCNLCKNQKPLMDEFKKSEIFFVGLSAKLKKDADDKPLGINTNTGKVISMIENELIDNTIYKTNLVKCVPLDDNLKLRYPTKLEMNTCVENLNVEIIELKPKIIFLLGKRVEEIIRKYYLLDFKFHKDLNYRYSEYKGIYFIPVYHPSYIHTYKKEKLDEYVQEIKNISKEILERK